MFGSLACLRSSSASNLALSDQQRPLSRSSSVAGEDIVHLVVQKPYRLGWNHQPGEDRLELSISADSTAGAVAAELEVGQATRHCATTRCCFCACACSCHSWADLWISSEQHSAVYRLGLCTASLVLCTLASGKAADLLYTFTPGQEIFELGC